MIPHHLIESFFTTKGKLDSSMPPPPHPHPHTRKSEKCGMTENFDAKLIGTQRQIHSQVGDLITSVASQALTFVRNMRPQEDCRFLGGEMALLIFQSGTVAEANHIGAIQCGHQVLRTIWRCTSSQKRLIEAALLQH